MENISRQEFLQRTAFLLSSLKGFALATGQKKIKVGIIGCGSVSGQYLPHLSKSPYVELVSCCDIIYDRAQHRATEFNIPATYPHIDQFLAGPAFDLMLTLTDMQEHGRLNKQALLAGRNVWSEKPLANTYREGRELLDLAKQQQLRIWGAPAVVNSPQFAFMSAAIREGKLGKISSAHAHYGRGRPRNLCMAAGRIRHFGSNGKSYGAFDRSRTCPACIGNYRSGKGFRFEWTENTATIYF